MKKIAWILLVGLTSLTLAFMTKEKEKSEFLSETFKSANGSLHYKKTGKEGAPLWILIHGSPGDWKAMKSFLEDTSLTNHFQMIAIDRPGYGYSALKKGRKQNLDTQVELVSALIDSLHKKQKIIYLMGHSYGGALTVKLLVERHYFSGAMLVAPTLSPLHQKKRFYNYLASFFRPILSKDLQKSNEEMWVLRRDLEILKQDLKEIDVPICLIHGTKDWLVSYKTVQYCEENIPKPFLQVVTVQDGGHFILWKEHDLVIAQMKNLMEQNNFPKP